VRVDRDLLSRAYDRTASTYDEQFRVQQREKYRAAARLLEVDPPPTGPVLDAGGGTALFAEWLADPREPFAAVRAGLGARPLFVLDASLGMLRRAASRAPLRIAGDLEAPPFAGRFALVVAFTSLLGDAAAGVRALGEVLLPGGLLALTMLAAEAPPASRLFRAGALRHLAGPAPAGRDRGFLFRRG
jgi:SAM-dependent methyltransferase